MCKFNIVVFLIKISYWNIKLDRTIFPSVLKLYILSCISKALEMSPCMTCQECDELFDKYLYINDVKMANKKLHKNNVMVNKYAGQ